MRTVINSYNPEGVDEAVLRGTGRGGFLSDGYLRDEPLASYLGADETVVFVRSNTKRGVSYDHHDSEKNERITPGDGYRAFAAVTDARVLFVIGDTQKGEGGDHSIAVPLTDIELVDGSEGVLANELAVTTRADVVWRFPCKGGLEDVVEYLEVASMTWMKVESNLETARKRVVDASQHRESGDYDDAMQAIRDASEETGVAREREREFAADGVAAMATRISRLEDRGADAKRRTHEERATNCVDTAERQWRADEYREAYDNFRTARDDYVAALDIETGDSKDSKRLREKLARVERNLDALERAPLERARRACERASDTDDPAERVTHLERALERYRTALELDWGLDDRRFAGEKADIRERVVAVASELVETRRRRAVQHAQEGDTRRENGCDDQAEQAYRTAHRILCEALETAEELVPDLAETVVDHREAVERRLNDLDDSGAAVVYSD